MRIHNIFSLKSQSLNPKVTKGKVQLKNMFFLSSITGVKTYFYFINVLMCYQNTSNPNLLRISGFGNRNVCYMWVWHHMAECCAEWEREIHEMKLILFRTGDFIMTAGI